MFWIMCMTVLWIMWITFVDRKLFTGGEAGGKQLCTEKNRAKIRKIRWTRWKNKKLSTNYQQIVDNF